MPRSTWALIVSIDQYADPTLSLAGPRPAFDALQKTLSDPKRYPSIGARLLVLTGGPTENPASRATAQAIRDALRRIAQEALSTDDLLVVWRTRCMSGDGETRWLAQDAHPSRLAATSLLSGEINELLQSIRCRHRVIVVDPSPAPETWNAPPQERPLRGSQQAGASPSAEWSGPSRLVVGPSDGRAFPNQATSERSKRFFESLSSALAGAADRDGGEADGWISTTEVLHYLKEQAPATVAFGTDPMLWIGRNPAQRPKLDSRRAALVASHDRKEISDLALAQGLRLFDRTPRFEEDRALRSAFIELVQGTMRPSDLERLREEYFQKKQLSEVDALHFSQRVREALSETLARHVHPEDIPQSFSEGCYDLAEAFDVADEIWVPKEIAEIVAQTTGDLEAPLRKFRLRLGRRPQIKRPAEAILLDGLLHALDPYSAYLSEETFRALTQQSQSRFTGIGVILRESPRDSVLTVMMPIPGGPAERAGLREGDLILSVDGSKTADIGPSAASEKLTGPSGSNVRLEVSRPSVKPFEATLPREDVPLVTVVGFDRDEAGNWRYWIPPNISGGRGAAYIRITRFAGDTADRLSRILKDLESEGMTDLILDLRFNPGGLMEAANDVADLFLDEGTIVRLRDRHGKERDRRAVRIGTFRVPRLVVLINGESASGAEIVAAAIQDSGRGIVAGSRSFGKGSIQEVVPLPDGKTGLKITSALFLRPNGKNLERYLGGRRAASDTWGVTPTPGWEVDLYREEQERLRDLMVRQQYLGASADTLARDPVLAYVLKRRS